MRAFALTAEQACIFFEVCAELKAVTIAQRTAVLEAMAELGQVKSLTETPMNKDEYINHLQKHFVVAEVKTNGSIGPVPTSDDQPKGK